MAVRRPRLPSSLRGRLVLAVIALMAAALLVIGIALPMVMRGFLIDKVDRDLYAAAERAGRSDDSPGLGPGAGDGLGQDGDGFSEDGDGLGQDGDGFGPGSPKGLVRPGQAIGTLGAVIEDGVVTGCAVLDKNGEPVECSDKLIDELGRIEASGEPQSVHLHRYDDYRVLAQQTSTGVQVTGLPLRSAAETIGRLVVIELVVAAMVIAVAAFVAWRMIQQMLRPLERVAATARRVAGLPLDSGEVHLAERVPASDADPRTESGQVGAALNQLLSHVESALEARQRSEQQVRSFVADASHELRTPLAAIRGYAELTKRERDSLPPDVAHALRRVESEGQRMTALVEDLLLLARLDAGRPLDREPVDLAALIIDAVSDAHAAGPDHTWNLELPDEAIEVPGDRARLHQVIANLLANPRTHTPPGTVVQTRLALSEDGRSAVITVTDDGPGIAPELLPQVFDRFARGDSSRSRENGSTGLGLAIVAAVAASHGGTVDVTSEPGRTTFTVTLPLESPPSAA